LTAGTGEISGGHRYHQHLLTAAAGAGFDMRVERPRVRWALPPADVVVIDSLYAWAMTGAVRRRNRPPAVAIVHQHPGGTQSVDWRRSLRRRLDVTTYRACELVVAPGAGVADLLVSEHGLERARVTVIEPGADLPPARPLPPLRAGRRLGLLNVANWLPNKGVLHLLDAIALLPPDDVTLHLAGRTDVDTEYTHAIRRRIGRADLADRVVVHGPLDASCVASLYAAADAFAFPSGTETYGSAAGEALAAGLPVVGWRSPHLCALVDDDVEGLLVTPGRTDQLARAIRRLAVDPVLRGRLARDAARRGARLPTWRQTTDRFFGSLAGLVSGSVEPPH
jgi:glycosyltransferase involved in cell wall biosynthesis